MRYVIETTEKGNEESVWNSINAMRDKKLITIVEKSDPVEQLKETLRRLARSMEILEKVGIDKEMMVIYLSKKSGAGMGTVRNVLYAQEEFFGKLGVKLK